jgi:hypothetical protein
MDSGQLTYVATVAPCAFVGSRELCSRFRASGRSELGALLFDLLT